jgi:hypothetical protein
MKMKDVAEDFISKNLKEFYGIEYCRKCGEALYNRTRCCSNDTPILFEHLDKTTQRAIVMEEFNKYV